MCKDVQTGSGVHAKVKLTRVHTFVVVEQDLQLPQRQQIVNVLLRVKFHRELAVVDVCVYPNMGYTQDSAGLAGLSVGFVM